MKGQLEIDKIGRAVDVGIPATALANKVNAVACVADHAAAVGDAQAELFAGTWSRGQHHQKRVVAPLCDFVAIDSFVLEEDQGASLCVLGRLQGKVAGKLERDHPFSAAQSLERQQRGALEGVVSQDGSLQRVGQGLKRRCGGRGLCTYGDSAE